MALGYIMIRPPIYPIFYLFKGDYRVQCKFHAKLRVKVQAQQQIYGFRFAGICAAILR